MNSITAKSIKLKKLRTQLEIILSAVNERITTKNSSAGFLFEGAMFPEVKSKLEELEFEVLLTDIELVPKYYIDYSNVILTQEELEQAFSPANDYITNG